MKVLRALARFAGADAPHSEDVPAKPDHPEDDPETTEHEQDEPEGGLALKFVLTPKDPDERP